MSIRKFRAARVNTTTASTYVGQPGDMFYDEATGQLKISDGTTPGGHFINLVVASTTQLGGIKAGPGANVSVDGTLTINTAGLPLSIGDLDIVNANISTVNANENLNLVSNGTGSVNIVGNLHVHTTAQNWYGDGPSDTPILEVTDFGNVITNGNLVVNGRSFFYGNVTEIGNLLVTGNTVNNGATTFNGQTIFNGNTIRTGDTTQSGNTTVTGISTYNGLSTFNGNVTTNGNLNIVGNTVQAGNLTINGTTINNGLSVFVGNINMIGNTIQTGSTYLVGNTYVVGDTFQTGAARFTVTQQNSTTGAVEITGDLNGLSQTPINTGVMLHVTGQSNLPSRIYNDAMGNYGLFTGRRFEGTMAGPTGVQGNIDLVRYSGAPYTTTGWANIGPARMTITTNEIQTGTNQGGRIEFWTTANSAGPAYSTISRTATIDPALGVTAIGFSTAGNIAGGNIIVGGLTVANNFIYSTLTSSDITIGQIGATANIVMNRNTNFANNVNVTGNVTAPNFFGTATQVSNSLTAGYGLKLSSGTTYNGSTALTINKYDTVTGPVTPTGSGNNGWSYSLDLGTATGTVIVDPGGAFTGTVTITGTPVVGKLVRLLILNMAGAPKVTVSGLTVTNSTNGTNQFAATSGNQSVGIVEFICTTTALSGVYMNLPGAK